MMAELGKFKVKNLVINNHYKNDCHSTSDKEPILI